MKITKEYDNDLKWKVAENQVLLIFFRIDKNTSIIFDGQINVLLTPGSFEE